MDFKELNKKKEADLHKILADTRNKLRELRFKDANKQLKDIRDIRESRKIVAQILTLLNVDKTEKDNSKSLAKELDEISSDSDGKQVKEAKK